jgi:ABC-type transport system involved in multi-copper enzyme maturation permease subunit
MLFLLIVTAGIYVAVPLILDLETTTFIKRFVIGMFMSFGIATAIIALNIFKDGERDGTELIVISKPITRGEILTSKTVSFFLIMFIYMIFNATIVVLGSVLTASDILITLGNYAVGVSMTIMMTGAVAILFSLVYGHIGTIAFTTFFIFLISLAIFVVPMFVGQKRKIGNTLNNVVSTFVLMDDANRDNQYQQIAIVTGTDGEIA